MRLPWSGELLDEVRGLRWPVRRPVRSGTHGAHRSTRTGSSPEFIEYRPYRQGDDLSKIDWKLYARTNRPAIRLALDSASVATSVIVDASASMDFPSGARSKWDMAAAMTLGLCAVAQASGDPIGLIVAGNTPASVLPPRTRRGTLAEVERTLAEVPPRGTNPLTPALALARASRRLAIVSDFLGDTEALIQRARALRSAGVELYVVHVVARAELEPDTATRMVADPEDLVTRRPFDRSMRAAYETAFAEWRAQLARAWVDSGASYTLVLTDEAPAAAVRRVVKPPEAGASRPMNLGA